MKLLSIATASPEYAYSQRDCYEIFLRSEAKERLKERSCKLMEKILLRDNGISTRRFSYPEIDTIFDAGNGMARGVWESRVECR